MLKTEIIDGINRLMCTDNHCRYVHWNNPVPVVAALVMYNSQYIIARNANWPPGLFSLITGYLEHGETPEQAAIREVSEELGLTAQVSRYIGHYSFFEKNQLLLCYEMQATGTIKINHELAEIKILSHDELHTYNFKPFYITENIIKDWYHDAAKL